MAAVILAVDRNPRNAELLGRVLERSGYTTLRASSLDDFDREFREHGPIDLALIDIAGFDHGVWERCDRLRDGGVPFVIISPRTMSQVREDSVRHGARGNLVKPLVVDELLGLVRGLLAK